MISGCHNKSEDFLLFYSKIYVPNIADLYRRMIIVEDSQISKQVENTKTGLLKLLAVLDVEVLIISVCILNQLNIYPLASSIPSQYQI